MSEVRREVVKIGMDFRPIPVDVGDGIEWGFHPDPSPEQWAKLMGTLKEFTKFGDDDFDGTQFKESLKAFTLAMSELIVDEDQREKWINNNYGLGPQQAISEALMEIWTGMGKKPGNSSGKGSKKTG